MVMNCEVCGNKIKRTAYKWLDTIHCYRCFMRKQSEASKFDIDVQWDYEMIDIKTKEVKAQTTLGEYT